MRFKGLRGFGLGKSKNNPEEDKNGAVENTAEQISEMEEQMNNRTKDLEETAQQLQELSADAEGATKEEEPEVRPHGPLGELEVTPEDKSDDVDFDTDVNVDSLLGDDQEEIKVVEAGSETDTPLEGVTEVKLDEPGGEATPQTEGAPEVKEVKLEEAEDSINNLFGGEDEDENPLANLINAMPDVTTEELLDDLKEINEIIKEWQQS